MRQSERDELKRVLEEESRLHGHDSVIHAKLNIAYALNLILDAGKGEG